MQIRRACVLTIYWSSCLLALLLAGCAPTLSSLTKMRLIQGEASARKQQQRLLKAFSEERKPPLWRVEAMTTMTLLDRKFRFHQTEPDLRKQLVQELYGEYSDPNVPVDSFPSETEKVKAWSIYSLSRLDEPAPAILAFLLELFERQDRKSDPNLAITAAAGNGLLRPPGSVWKDADMRRRLLSRAAQLKGNMFARTRNQYVRDVWNMIRVIQSQHLSFTDVVQLLAAERKSRDNARLLEILQWDHEALTAGGDATVPEAIRKDNVQHLLFFSSDKDYAVRQRSRSVLMLHAPRTFLLDLEKRLTATAVPDDFDYDHGIQLISILDGKKQNDKDYSLARAKILARFSKDLKRHPEALRERSYGRLLQVDRAFLAQHLLAWNDLIRGENLKLNLQQLRYLWLVQEGEAGKPFQPAARKAIAAWISKKSKTVRQVVIAYLLDSDPLLLAADLAPLLTNAKGESAPMIPYLVDTYLTALAKGKAEITRDVRAALKGALATQHVGVQSKVAHLLSTRDPDLFVALQAAALRRGSAAKRSDRLLQFALLGDRAWAARNKLKPDTRKSVYVALMHGFDPKDEELSLLCMRHLRQLGGMASKDQLKKLPQSVSVLAGIKPTAEKGGVE